MTASAAPYRLSAATALVVARAIRAPLWLLVSALMARVMGPEGLGVWAMLMAAAMLLNQVFILWSQSITQRFGRLEWENSSRLTRTWATRWPLLVFAALAILALSLLIPPQWLSSWTKVPQECLWLIIPLLISLWLMGETQGLQQVKERYLALAWSPLFADAALIVTLFVLSLRFVFEIELTTSELLLVPCLSGMLVWGALFRRELKDSTLGVQRPDKQGLRLALGFALPLLPGYLIGYLAEWCDYFLVGHLLGERYVGIYHPAYQYMLILIGLPTAIVSILMPQLISRVNQVGDSGERHLVERVAPQIMCLWIMASVFLIAILPLLFSILVGPSFAESFLILQVLLAAVPGGAATHLYGLVHFSQGRLFTANVGLFGVKLVVNVLLSLVLLPVFGVLGAAIAAVIGFLVVQWLFMLDQHRYMKLPIRKAAAVLVLAHASGLLLIMADHWGSRLLLAGLQIGVVLFFARRACFFSPDEVCAMVPRSLRPVASGLSRMLCN